MVKAYAVNWSEAWPIPDDEPKNDHYVKYEDYAALENLLIAVVAAVGPCDIPDHLLDALCEAGVLE